MPCTHDYTCAVEGSSAAGAGGVRCQLCGRTELPIVVALELPCGSGGGGAGPRSPVSSGGSASSPGGDASKAADSAGGRHEASGTAAASSVAESPGGGDEAQPWAALGLRMRYPYVEAVDPDGPAEAHPGLRAGLRLMGVLREGLGWVEGVDQLPEADVLDVIRPSTGAGPETPQQLPRRVTLKFAALGQFQGSGATDAGTSRSVGALRELDPGAVGAKNLSELDAVMTLSRVSFDAHRHAPSKMTRLDAVNKLVQSAPHSRPDNSQCGCALTAACLVVRFQRIAEQLLHTAIQMSDTGKTDLAPLQDPETRRLLEARLKQTRKRLRSLNSAVAPPPSTRRSEETSFGGVRYFDPTAVRRPKFPSAATVKRRRSLRAGSTLDTDYSLEEELLPAVTVSRLDLSYPHGLNLSKTAAVRSPGGRPKQKPSNGATGEADEGPSWRELSYTHGLALSKTVVVCSPVTSPKQKLRSGARSRTQAGSSRGQHRRAARSPPSGDGVAANGGGDGAHGEGPSWRDVSQAQSRAVSKTVVVRSTTPQQRPRPGQHKRAAGTPQSGKAVDDRAAGNAVSPWASGEDFSSSPLQTNGPEENDNLESSWIELHEKTSDLNLKQEALEAERHDVKARLAAAVEAEKRAQQARAQIEADRLELLQLRDTMEVARRTLVSNLRDVHLTHTFHVQLHTLSQLQFPA